jgi:hypothetical protein
VQDAGVWVFAGGVYPHDEVSPSVVAPDGTITDGAGEKAYIAGVTIVDVPSLEEALQWAAKIAAALPLSTRGPRVRGRPGGRELIRRVDLGRLIGG